MLNHIELFSAATRQRECDARTHSLRIVRICVALFTAIVLNQLIDIIMIYYFHKLVRFTL